MLNFLIVHSLYYISICLLACNLITACYKKKYIFCIGGLFAFISAILSYFSVDSKNTIFLFLLIIGFVFILFEGKIIKKLFVVIFHFFSSFVGEVFANLILNIFLGLDYLSNINSIGFIIVSVLSGTITVLFSYLIMRLIKGLNWKQYPSYVYLIFVLPITTIILILNINNYLAVITNNKILILALILLIISNFITFYVFISVINVTQKLKETENQKKLIDLRFEYMKKLYSSNFNVMHNIIRKLMKIQNYMNEDNYKSFKTELYHLNQSILKNFNIINSNSSIVSSIINSYLDKIDSNHIQYKSVIETDDFCFMSINDLRDFFYHLLNIGIESCILSNEKEKLVILKTKKQDVGIIVQILFTSNKSKIEDELNIDFQAIKEIVSKYNGNIVFDVKFDDNINSISVLF